MSALAPRPAFLGKRFLCAVFLAAGLGAGAPALALTGKDRPKIQPGQTLPHLMPPPTGARPQCVQRANAGVAARNGYASVSTLRRAGALAQIYDRDVIAAMVIASTETGIDFDLLVMKAHLESRMGRSDQPDLGGRARGLFHFMPATWMTLFSWFGAEFENGFYADVARQIRFDDRKDTFTHSDTLTESILALRSDPYVAAFIKAKSVRNDERPLLRAVLGREPTYTDYYVAHFLGLERAKPFFRTLRKNPRTAAADIFVRESEDPNNRPIFYAGARKRSIQQVYALLDGKVTATLRQIDNKIAAELKGDSCVNMITLVAPPRVAIAIPPVPEIPLPPESPPPPAPREDREPEPEDKDIPPTPPPGVTDTNKAEPQPSSP